MIDRQTFGPQTAAYYTLGCKLNFAETSTIGRMLEERGIRRARNGEPVDIGKPYAVFPANTPRPSLS